MKHYLLLGLAFLCTAVFSQDLNKVDVNKLSPEQLEMYKQYMSTKGSAQGSSTKTVSYENRKLNNDSIDTDYDEETDKDTDSKSNKKTDSKLRLTKKGELPVYGTYLFSSQKLNFEPKLNIATPTNYVLGAYDEVVVDVSGLYEANYKLKVSPEGTIRIPNVGPVRVAGLSIDAATRNIKSEVSKVYPGIAAGQTRINISLGNIRSIRVSIIGHVTHPGTYTLPSLATAFNALYACGGPSEMGSMRQVKVIRNGKQIAKLDIYKFLTDGVLANNVLLHDDDVIKVEPYINRISLRGAVKNVGRFEGLEGEVLSDLLRHAGGFTDSAYTQLATVVRVVNNQKQVMDVKASDYASFKLMPGDDYFFSTMTEKYSNRIEIKGAVVRPGVYSLDEGLTVSQLIRKASGLKEDAFMNMAVIYRKRDNQVPEMINFRLGDVLTGKIDDIVLKRDDKVEIKSVLEQREDFEVSISGEVKEPGKFVFVENMTLMDLVLMANGFTEAAATDSIELVRMVKDAKLLANSGKKSITYKFKVDKELNMSSSDAAFVLQNGDRVVVRRISGFESIQMVRIEGEISRPGDYNLTSKKEYISDLIRRAGGFTKYAYPKGAFLIRNPNLDNPQIRMNGFLMDAAQGQLAKKSNNLDASVLEKLNINADEGMDKIDSLQNKLNGGDIIEKISNVEGLVGINLQEILNNPHGKYDIYLEEGDLIYIPKQLQTVRVMGEVFLPTYVRYDESRSLKDYLSNAGGPTSKALRKSIFVLYPNGTSKSTKSFLGMKFYPKVTPGTQILVPRKQLDITQKMTTGETISILSTITSSAALIYSIIKQ